jgi:hypothetical protein
MMLDGRVVMARRGVGRDRVATALCAGMLAMMCWDCQAAQLVVTNTANSGAGSLRQAILDANSSPNSGGADEILFAIPGGGTHTIPLSTPLPQITEGVLIDGASQPGYSGTPLIEVSGALLGTGMSGLDLRTTGCRVRGLAINGFQLSGIHILTGGHHTIEGNRIGTDPGGGVTFRNAFGIYCQDTVSNLIGGTTTASRNIISGNGIGVNLQVRTSGTQVLGNYIGTDATGTSAVPNTTDGVNCSGDYNRIGGSAPGMGNLISGNLATAIDLIGTGTVIQGNMIGLDATGEGALPNNGYGILVRTFGDGTRIGGSASGEGNVIACSAQGQGVHVNLNAVGEPIAIEGNRIGTNAAGTAARPNAYGGVAVMVGPARIGGPEPGQGNTISGNDGYGIGLLAFNTTGSVVMGNLIGIGADGTTPVPNNGPGVSVTGDDHGVGGQQPGQGNRIAHNFGAGVSVGQFADRDRISGNFIHGNTGLGIDLHPFGVSANDAGDADTGGNGRLNFPVIAAVATGYAETTVTGTYSSAANSSYTLEFFHGPWADPTGYGEGEEWLGSCAVSTDATGSTSFECVLPAAVPDAFAVTATSRDASGNTSEFCAAGTAVFVPVTLSRLLLE